MKYNVSLLKADIEDELEKIDMIVAEFNIRKAIVDRDAEEVPFYDRGAIGYMVHNFYNGCENIFKSIAKFFENDLGPQSWHKDLLKRMKIEIPGFRPRVIDDHLYILLDDFRSFRHKFRHLYAFELDWERERIIARKMDKTVKLIKQQINKFLKKLPDL